MVTSEGFWSLVQVCKGHHHESFEQERSVIRLKARQVLLYITNSILSVSFVVAFFSDCVNRFGIWCP